MRHRKSGRKLNRTASHRKALLRNLANQLIEHKEIKTTTEKAKEARSTVERLITYAKKGDLHHRRLAFGFLQNKDSIKILFDEIGPSFTDRPGGYTRVLKLGRRLGDGASLSLLQLVGYEKLTDVSKTEKKKKQRKKAKEETAEVEKTTDDKTLKSSESETATADDTSPEQAESKAAPDETAPVEPEVKPDKVKKKEK
jgi:large subunit ribosomal protein L17